MNQLDQYFKKQLESHEMQPSAKAWDKIAQSGVIGPKKNIVLPLYRRIAVAAAISAGVIVAAAIWMRPEGTPQDTFALDTPLEYTTDTMSSSQKGATNQSSDIIEKSDTIEKEDAPEKDTDGSKTEKSASPSSPKSPASSKPGGRRMPSAEEKMELKEKRSMLAYQPVEMLDSYIPQTLTFNIEQTYNSLNQALLLASNPPVLKYDNGPVDWEAIMYANQIPKEIEEESLTGKLFQLASEKISTFADASGLSFSKLSRISEIEIIY